MQVMRIRLMSKIEYLIVPKGTTKFTGSGELGLKNTVSLEPAAEVVHFIYTAHIKWKLRI